MKKKTCKKKNFFFLYFNLAKVFAPVIFDSSQFTKVYSSQNVCHAVIRESLCESEFFSSRNFLFAKVCAPKVIHLIVDHLYGCYSCFRGRFQSRITPLNSRSFWSSFGWSAVRNFSESPALSIGPFKKVQREVISEAETVGPCLVRESKWGRHGWHAAWGDVATPLCMNYCCRAYRFSLSSACFRVSIDPKNGQGCPQVLKICCPEKICKILWKTPLIKLFTCKIADCTPETLL